MSLGYYGIPIVKYHSKAKVLQQWWQEAMVKVVVVEEDKKHV